MDVIKYTENALRGEKHVTFCRLAVIPRRKHRHIVHYGTANMAGILMILLAINMAGKISTPEIQLILNYISNL